MDGGPPSRPGPLLGPDRTPFLAREEVVFLRHPHYAALTMKTLWPFLLAMIVIIGGMMWVSDWITLEGERTVYTVTCPGGVWDGLRCTGRIAAGDRYRFRASRSRGEVLYWIAGSSAPSGKYTDCQVANRANWTCNVQIGQPLSIALEFSNGRPTFYGAGLTAPFYGVAKWKWWAIHFGIPGITEADFRNRTDSPRP
jgi:hypothetical protein